MKKNILLFLLAVQLLSCSSGKNDKTVADAKDLQQGIAAMQPGGIPTSKNGWTMTAKIDGKEWVASSLISPEAAGRIVGENNGISISLPYDRRSMIVGDKDRFSHNNAVDLFLPSDEGGILGGYEGEMEVTKVDNEWAEGTFHFKGSGNSQDKVVDVTDGFFRISLIEKK